VRAVLCRSFGALDNLTLEDGAPLVAPDGQVVVAVRACGINFFDGLIVEGKYQIKPPFPFSPGAEFSGVIKSTGAGVTCVEKGTRVLGFTSYGALAEEIAVEPWRLIPIPSEMDDAVAAAFPIAYATSFHALKDRGRLRPAETLLVLGAAGGVGLAAVELGKLMGARVIAAASSDDKLALCREYGADELLNYKDVDLRERLRQITGGRGVDVVFDPVGGSYAEPCVRSLAMDARYLVVGFAAGEIPRIAFNLVLLRSAALVGVFWGAFAEAHRDANRANFQQLLDWWRDGKLRPHVSATFPLERFRDAIETVVQRRAKGKVVVTMAAAPRSDHG
jgi:NADPH2:quinone reductase